MSRSNLKSTRGCSCYCLLCLAGVHCMRCWFDDARPTRAVSQRGWIGIVGLAIALLALGGFVYALVQEHQAEEAAWAAFVVEHDCKVTRRIAAKTVSGIGVDNKGGVTSTSHRVAGQTCWVCDDGVEYCR